MAPLQSREEEDQTILKILYRDWGRRRTETERKGKRSRGRNRKKKPRRKWNMRRK